MSQRSNCNGYESFGRVLAMCILAWLIAIVVWNTKGCSTIEGLGRDLEALGGGTGRQIGRDYADRR